MTEMATSRRKLLIDIAVNLTDPMFKGIYNGSSKHIEDLSSVLERAWKTGVEKMLITGTTLTTSKDAIDLAISDPKLFATVGCHPTNSGEWSQEGYAEGLLRLVEEDKNRERRVVAAWGECGLDYDRLHFCEADLQRKSFDAQLSLNREAALPLFLHCRAAFDDFFQIIKSHSPLPAGGVVHSFDGSFDQAKQLIDQGLYIGINGCSLRTQEGLDVVAKLPLDRLLLETDSPWCQARPTHPSYSLIKTHFDSVKKEKWRPDCMVKGRNEPANVIQILEVVAALQNDDIDKVSDQIYQNTVELFFNGDVK